MEEPSASAFNQPEVGIQIQIQADNPTVPTSGALGFGGGCGCVYLVYLVWVVNFKQPPGLLAAGLPASALPRRSSCLASLGCRVSCRVPSHRPLVGPRLGPLRFFSVSLLAASALFPCRLAYKPGLCFIIADL